MEKYEEMKKDKPVFTLAQSIEMGEWQARMIEEDNKKEAFEEGKQKGREKGIQEGEQKGRQEERQSLLSQLILSKYGVDASKWLSTLGSEQLEQVATSLLTKDSFDELQKSIQ